MAQSVHGYFVVYEYYCPSSVVFGYVPVVHGVDSGYGLVGHFALLVEPSL